MLQVSQGHTPPPEPEQIGLPLATLSSAPRGLARNLLRPRVRVGFAKGALRCTRFADRPRHPRRRHRQRHQSDRSDEARADEWAEPGGVGRASPDGCRGACGSVSDQTPELVLTHPQEFDDLALDPGRYVPAGMVGNGKGTGAIGEKNVRSFLPDNLVSELTQPPLDISVSIRHRLRDSSTIPDAHVAQGPPAPDGNPSSSR